TLEHITGYTLDEFFDHLYKIAPAKLYSHNLKFDGAFIIDYLLKNGFNHTTEKTINKGEFATLISETKVFYSITVCLDDKRNTAKKIIEFRDSSKKLVGTVADIARSY